MAFFFLDIDECLRNPCSTNGICTNNKGAYTCECKTGFSGDGVTCQSM